MAFDPQGSHTVPALCIPCGLCRPTVYLTTPRHLSFTQATLTVSSALTLLLLLEKPRDCLLSQIICGLHASGRVIRSLAWLLALPSRPEPEQGKVRRNRDLLSSRHPHPHHPPERRGRCVPCLPWLSPDLTSPVPAQMWRGHRMGRGVGGAEGGQEWFLLPLSRHQGHPSKSLSRLLVSRAAPPCLPGSL